MSEFSGKLEAREYLIESVSYMSLNSLAHKAQFLLVDSCFPSKFRYSLAGILCGRFKSPLPNKIAGSITE